MSRAVSPAHRYLAMRGAKAANPEATKAWRYARRQVAEAREWRKDGADEMARLSLAEATYWRRLAKLYRRGLTYADIREAGGLNHAEAAVAA